MTDPLPVPSRAWRLAGLALCAIVPGCAWFGSKGNEQTEAAQNQKITQQVDKAVTPMRQEVDELRNQTVENTREIGVLKTQVEVIQRDVSRRPVITPTESGGRPVPVETGAKGAESGGGDAEAAALADKAAREKAAAAARDQEERDRQERLKKEEEELARAKADKAARDKAAAEAAARDQEERDRQARLKAEEERLAREKAEAERKAREKAAAEAGGHGPANPKAAGTPSPGKSEEGGVQIPSDATPEEKAALLINGLRTTSDVESVARQMVDVSRIVAPALLRMLGDAEMSARFRAEKALGFLDPKVVTPLLIDQLKNGKTQLATIKILGNLGDPSAVPAVAAFLNQESPDLRFYAADSLVRLKDKRAIPILIDCLKGTDSAKSAIAYDTLRQRTGQSFPFPYFGSKEEREKAVQPWEQWWKEKGDKFEFK